MPALLIIMSSRPNRLDRRLDERIALRARLRRSCGTTSGRAAGTAASIYVGGIFELSLAVRLAMQTLRPPRQARSPSPCQGPRLPPVTIATRRGGPSQPQLLQDHAGPPRCEFRFYEYSRVPAAAHAMRNAAMSNVSPATMKR